MSQSEKGVLVFNEWLEAMEKLSARDYKMLMNAMYKYQIYNEEPPIFQGKVEVLAKVIFPCLERRKKLSEAGKKGRHTRTKEREGVSNLVSKEDSNKVDRVSESTLVPKEKNSTEKNSTAKSSEFIGRADVSVEIGEKRAPSHEKRARGKYGNVFLSDKEYEEITRVIFNADAYIERFSEKMHVKGYRFESHFDAIMHWWEWDKNLPQYSAPRGLTSTLAEREQPRARTAEDEHWDEFFEAAVARSLGMEDKKQ
ncbi:MAG: hypothetical protein E7592_05165 [Ruminococcaceae bacterium]|nr:hypothetical protein [Oscillospiraceae bacterium]